MKKKLPVVSLRNHSLSLITILGGYQAAKLVLRNKKILIVITEMVG